MNILTLSNGVTMPQEGFGVYQVPDYDVCRQAVLDALEVGYRQIDTAQVYGNQKAVGDAVRASGIPREDIFVTSKVWVQDNSYGAAAKAIDRMLNELGFSYLDLVLLHQPVGDYIGAWRALEEAYEAGKVRAIGMANCYPHVITDICETVRIRPMVNQVELHPFFQQPGNLEIMKHYGVVPQAWAPFAEGRHNLFQNPTLTEIGKRYGKTAAQVALRWNIQRDVSVIPKSVHKERMIQNLDVWDFSLTDDEMKQISALDIGHSEIVNHFDPAFVQLLHSIKVHD
ncbi:MAG: aldo/keto reductase [Lachnospiraceae bacterium]|jgi:2,5-diketo-D-gluconate reductase A